MEAHKEGTTHQEGPFPEREAGETKGRLLFAAQGRALLPRKWDGAGAEAESRPKKQELRPSPALRAETESRPRAEARAPGEGGHREACSLMLGVGTGLPQHGGWPWRAPCCGRHRVARAEPPWG